MEGRLARLQLLRHRSRTTLTVGVVFIAASTGIGLANSVMDNVEDVRSWYRKAIVADFFVRATAPDMATGLSADLPDNVGAELKKVPGIQEYRRHAAGQRQGGGRASQSYRSRSHDTGSPRSGFN